MKIMWWGVGLLLLMSMMVWRQWPSPTPKVTMCDVGQGDGLVVTQGFSQLVIDVGSAGTGILSCLSRLMPFWDREIEAIVITHDDSDHAGALGEILERYAVDDVITNEHSMEAVSKIVRGQSRVIPTWGGQEWRWGAISARVLWPLRGRISSDDNGDSLVVRMELLGKQSFWLAADMDERVEEILLKSGKVVPTDILKVAHHGSGSASSEPFLEVLRPFQAWVSVGKENRYGHPSREVLDRLKLMGIQVRRTDEEGMIQF